MRKLGAQLTTSHLWKKGEWNKCAPFEVQSAEGMQSKHYAKPGECSHGIRSGGTLPPTLCDGGHTASPPCASVSSSLKWGQEGYPSHRIVLRRTVYGKCFCTEPGTWQISQVLAIHPQRLGKCVMNWLAWALRAEWQEAKVDTLILGWQRTSQEIKQCWKFMVWVDGWWVRV